MSERDPFRIVIIVLLAASSLGAIGAVAGGLLLGNPVLLDVAVTLGLSSGILTGVALAQAARARPLKRDEEPAAQAQGEAPKAPMDSVIAPEGSAPEPVRSNVRETFSRILNAALASTAPEPAASREQPSPKAVPNRVVSWFKDLSPMGTIEGRIGLAGLLGSYLALTVRVTGSPPAPVAAAIAAAACLAAAGLAVVAARYLNGIDPAGFPEAAGLCRGARVVAWILTLAAVSVGLLWAQQLTMLGVLHFPIVAVDILVCSGLLRIQRSESEAVPAFPLDLGVLSVLGQRPNVIASVLDSAEQQLGIDLRSTWALTMVRRSLEPLIIVLCLVGWLATSLTVVGVDEEGLVERLGVPVEGPPLAPGLHAHRPWPVDEVFRIPVLRVQALSVGHEGEEAGGPENVLWTVEHAANEYTLLLGNGRDLITIDAAVQYRIADPKAWRYHSQNPADALRAIAYRAVMRNTVNRTLSEALSENVVTLTDRMRTMVQQEADALGLGVTIVGFTIGGMHPPVMVAGAYEAVVSAELGKVTAVVNAQAYRNEKLPSAESMAVMSANNARAEGARALGRAAGEAWSFRAMESQYHASPEEYLFRRRLEALESGLPGLPYTVVDSRFQRDGGELWMTQ